MTRQSKIDFENTKHIIAIEKWIYKEDIFMFLFELWKYIIWRKIITAQKLSVIYNFQSFKKFLLMVYWSEKRKFLMSFFNTNRAFYHFKCSHKCFLCYLRFYTSKFKKSVGIVLVKPNIFFFVFDLNKERR